MSHAVPQDGFLCRVRVALLLCLSLLSVTADALPWLQPGPPFAISVVGPEGEQNLELEAALEDGLNDIRAMDRDLLSDRPPPERQIQRETHTLTRLLRSLGYYDSNIRIQRQERDWLFAVESGPLYRVSELQIQWPEVTINGNRELDLGIEVGDPLLAAEVLKGKSVLEAEIEKENCLLITASDYQVLINHVEASASLVYRVQPSVQVNVGDIRLEGLESVREEALTRRLNLEHGECFKRGDLNSSKTNLLQSNLIATLTTEESVNEDVTLNGLKTVDIVFRMQERNHRTVKAGVGYSTDERFAVSTGWEHRNLLQGGERFNVDLSLGYYINSLNSQLVLPHYGAERQVLTLNADLEDENRDTYDSLELTVGAILSRQLSDHWLLSGGSEFKLSEVEDRGESESYALLYFPLSVTHTTVRQLLDPRQGWIVTAQFIPYIDALDTGRRFAKYIGSGSTYFSFGVPTGTATLALRAASGVITGASDGDGIYRIPADERYYVGGGGSVRGYAYQSVGVLDADQEAIGGRSFAEMSTELRLRHGTSWGTVWFLDGGYAYQSQLPGSIDRFLWGAGLGVRYYTSFAPIRFDIAWPLDRRPGVDDIVQIYLNIGQAF